MYLERKLGTALILAILITGLAGGQGNSVAIVVGHISDTLGAPLTKADVSFPAFGIWTRSGDGGEFKIADVPVGTHRILVRRIGYGPVEETVVIAAGTTTLKPFRLVRIQTLDTVVTRSSYRDPGMEEFAERRALGLGHFLTRMDLDKHRGSPVSSFLQQTPGLVLANFTGKDWIGGKRPMRTNCSNAPPRVPQGGMPPAIARCLQLEGMYYVPDEVGAPVMCHARVYQDEQLMNPGSPTPPFDLRSVVPGQVEGLEWYTGATQVPVKYMARNSSCGVLVIRTRRP